MYKLENINTSIELADAMAKSVKLKQWHIFNGIIGGKRILVKCFGLYIQVFNIDGVRYGNTDLKSQKEMKRIIINTLA